MNKVRIKLAPNGDVYRNIAEDTWVLLTHWDDYEHLAIDYKYGPILSDEEVMSWPTWCMPIRED